MRFRDILGHEKETAMLKKAVLNGRVAHAYLFSGPDGVGKKLLALSFAQALNCGDLRDDGDSCGVCPSCRGAECGSNVNILRVEPDEGVLRIDQIRDLQRVLKYSVENGRRVAVIEGADLMVRSASSVFLKTLEEPPGGAIVIMLSSRPDDLFSTILSRCQRVRLRPLGQGVISGVLTERYSIGREEAAAASRLSGGSLSMAIRLVEGGLLERRKKFLDGFKGLKGMDGAGLLDFASRLSKDKGIEEIFEFLKSRYRDLAFLRAGCPHLAVDNAIEARGDCPTIGGLLNSFDLVEEARRNILPPRYANRGMTVEALLIGLRGVLEEAEGTEAIS
ncbi:MAG: AAA family ATPase [Deltaproteobacteria bacterium]|nr:AAA family ATPase [Deltaproteobacteria bacterium]